MDDVHAGSHSLGGIRRRGSPDTTSDEAAGGALSVDVDQLFDASCHRETDALGWFNPAEMWSLALHPGFQRWVDAKWRF